MLSGVQARANPNGWCSTTLLLPSILTKEISPLPGFCFQSYPSLRPMMVPISAQILNSLSSPARAPKNFPRNARKCTEEQRPRTSLLALPSFLEKKRKPARLMPSARHRWHLHFHNCSLMQAPNALNPYHCNDLRAEAASACKLNPRSL